MVPGESIPLIDIRKCFYMRDFEERLPVRLLYADCLAPPASRSVAKRGMYYTKCREGRLH